MKFAVEWAGRAAAGIAKGRSACLQGKTVHILFGLSDHDGGAVSVTTWRRVSMKQFVDVLQVHNSNCWQRQ
jgi:hypothetical protein